MVSIKKLQASDTTGEAVRANVTVARVVGGTSLTVDSVSKWPTDSFIGTTGTLKADGTLDAATVQVFFGHISAGHIVIDSFAAGYTDLGSEVGDVVLLKPTTAWDDELVAILRASLNDDGTLNSTARGSRRIPRSTTTASTATLTPNIDNYNVYFVTAQAASLAIADPTGTPNDGDVIIIHLKDNGTTRAVTYGSGYQNISGLPSITTTTVSKWHTFGIQYNATAAKWMIISITTEA